MKKPGPVEKRVREMLNFGGWGIERELVKSLLEELTSKEDSDARINEEIQKLAQEIITSRGLFIDSVSIDANVRPNYRFGEFVGMERVGGPKITVEFQTQSFRVKATSR
jgi:hypothetical protein